MPGGGKQYAPILGVGDQDGALAGQKIAIENDVHVVGVSSLAAGHKYLVPEVRRELDKQGGKEIIVVVGGIIPPGDYDYLYERGVKAVFGPGTSVIDSANRTLQLIEEAAG